MRIQRGLTTVEFAIVGFVLFLVIFAIIDLNRIFYTYAALDEVTRRGARMAAVCPINDPEIQRAAIFNTAGGTASPLVGGLETQHILLEYLDEDGAVVPNPTATANFIQIEFVQVSIQNFQVDVLIPFIDRVITMPPKRTTMPRESLGIPRDGVVVAC